MASEAYGNVERAMDASREAELAAYIMRDVELRQQNAQGKFLPEIGTFSFSRLAECPQQPLPKTMHLGSVE